MVSAPSEIEVWFAAGCLLQMKHDNSHKKLWKGDLTSTVFTHMRAHAYTHLTWCDVAPNALVQSSKSSALYQYVCMCVCVCVCVCVRVCARARARVCAHVRPRGCERAHAHRSVYACACVHVSAHVSPCFLIHK